MLRTILLFLVVSTNWPSGTSADVKEENNILVLGEANFAEVINEKDTILVAFYIPICQRCAELELKLSAAAWQLKLAKRSDIAIAKVDAEAEAALAARLGVGSAAGADFPLLKLFSWTHPSEPLEFTGPVDTAEAIAAHLLASAGGGRPLASVPHRLTEGNLTEALARRGAWLVGFLDLAGRRGGSDADALEGLRAAAEELRGSDGDGVGVGYADALGGEAAMAGRLGLRTDRLPTFAVLRQGQDWAIPFSHQPSAANLAKFYRAHGSGSATSVASRLFATLDELDAVSDGLDALLLASSSARPAVRRFLAAFLVESGFFYERRLEGGLASDETGLAERLGVSSPDSVYVRLAPRLLTEGEPAVIRFPGPLDSTPALKAFFDRQSLPRLGLFGWNTRRAYMSAGRPLCIFYASLSGGWRGEAGRPARDTHARLARLIAGRGDALFAMADETQEAEEAARFGFDESSADVNLGCYDAARRRFPMPESDGPDPGDVRRFLDAFVAGAARQRIRSAAVPAAAGRRHLVAEVNAERLGRLLADGSGPVLLIQCDFANQPCAHSLGEFAAAAAAAAASSPLLGDVRFVRLNTRYSDAPGELYYRYEGDAAIDLAAAQPQVLLLLPAMTGSPAPIRYERDAVAKDNLLQFLTDRLVLPATAAAADSGRQEL